MECVGIHSIYGKALYLYKLSNLLRIDTLAFSKHALKRVNHDDIWRETASRLAALRAAEGDVKPITESLVRNAIQCRSVLHNDVHDCLVQTLRAEMDSAFRDAVMNNRQAALATRFSCWPCTRVVNVDPDSHSAELDSRRLYLLAVNDVFASTGVTLEMKLDRKIDEITFDELLHITGDVRNFAVTVAYMIMEPGSVSLFIDVPSEDANKLQRFFEEGEVKIIGGMAVKDIARVKAPPMAALKEPVPVMLDLREGLTKTDRRKLTEFVQHEQARAAQIQIEESTGVRAALLNMLGWLTSLNQRPRISMLNRIYLALIFVGASFVKSTLDLVIVWFPCRFGTRESLEHLRYSPCLLDSWDNLNRIRLGEESLNAFVIRPVMTATIIALFLVAFIHSGMLIALWAAASGAFLSAMGGLVCSSVLSIRACGAGGVALGIAFGVGNGLVALEEGGISSLVTAIAPGDAFAQIVGGLVAVDVHRSFGNSLAFTLLALVLPTLGMAGAARLMAQPLALKEQDRPAIWREATGSFLGSLVGFGVLILVEVAQLLGRVTDGKTAFLTADGVVSLAALLCLFHFRSVSLDRTAMFGLVYSLAGMTLTILALRVPLCWLSLLAGC